jgi:hypothetical protein
LFETREGLVPLAQDGVGGRDEVPGGMHAFGKCQQFVQRLDGVRVGSTVARPRVAGYTAEQVVSDCRVLRCP